MIESHESLRIVLVNGVTRKVLSSRYLCLVGPEALLVDLQLDEVLPERIPQIAPNAVVVEEVLKARHLFSKHFWAGKKDGNVAHTA